MFDKIKNFLKGFSKKERLRKKELKKQLEKDRRALIYSKAEEAAESANKRMQEQYCPINSIDGTERLCSSICIHFRRSVVWDSTFDGYRAYVTNPHCALWRD